MAGNQDGAGAKEQGDLAEGVHRDLQSTPGDPGGIGEHCPQDHVGQLADRRIGEPRLQIVLGQRHQRGEQDGDGGDIGERRAGSAAGDQLEAEHVDHDLQDREHAGLDHRHRMQQRADRGGRHHRGRQPAVERHQGGLADAEDVEGQEDRQQPAAHPLRQDAARLEVEAAGQDVGQGDRQDQEAQRGAEQEAQIDPPGPARLGRAAMGDQRIGRQRQGLVEHQEGQKIAGERDAHGAGQRQREAGMEAALLGVAIGAQIADRIDCGRQPQAARDQGEHQPQRLGGQAKLKAWQHLDERLRRALAGRDRRQEVQHQAEQRERHADREAVAQTRPSREVPDHRRCQCRQGDGQQHEPADAHGAGPTKAAAASSARPKVQPAARPNSRQATVRSKSGACMASGGATAAGSSGSGWK